MAEEKLQEVWDGFVDERSGIFWKRKGGDSDGWWWFSGQSLGA